MSCVHLSKVHCYEVQWTYGTLELGQIIIRGVATMHGNKSLISSSITTPQDAHKRLVMQVAEWLTGSCTISVFKGSVNVWLYKCIVIKV